MTVTIPTVIIPKQWTFSTLPESALAHFKNVHVLANSKSYRAKRDHFSAFTGASAGLFGMFDEPDEKKVSPQPTVKVSRVVWGTDNYETNGAKYRPAASLHDLSVIRPRVEKTKEEQKRRVKAKAEVFTPSWVCNAQNNLIDDEILYPNAFNTTDMVNKTWVAHTDPINFPKTDYTWLHYVVERRLEMCCGEGPYLFSRYDTTTGKYLPVKDAHGAWQRIGLLDRKFRVIAENATNLREWKKAAELAMNGTYGFEWQGDNLMLARLNMLNTYFDYYREFCEDNGFDWPPSEDLDELAVEISEIVSWQLWQMDGLKMVTPDSCSEKCVACAKGKRNFHGHDGVLPVIRWGSKLKVYEDMLIAGSDEQGKSNKSSK